MILRIEMGSNGDKRESVKVIIRCRPMDKKEIDEGHERFGFVSY